MPTSQAHSKPLDHVQAEVKKHVAAIHTKSALTLLQRKISNVLLLNAYEQLPDRTLAEHTISLAQLARGAGFDSNDYHLLRQALEALVNVRIRWNVPDENGDEEWGVSAFLSQAITKRGTCRYAYPPELRRRLYNPEIYARINLAVQERFASSYALALYENCVRYRKIGTTGWHSLETWRDLLSVEPGQYDAFKYLNRDVLKPAIREINQQSDIRVDMETRKEGRSVAKLRFSVVNKGAEELPDKLAGRLSGIRPSSLPHPREMAPEPHDLVGPLYDMLAEYGITQAQALDLSTEFGEERITANLDYVKAVLERGKTIRNVAAFTMQAIRQDYRIAGEGRTPVGKRVEDQRRRKDEEAQRKAERARNEEATAEKRRESEREAKLQRQRQRTESLDSYFAGLSEPERLRIDAIALARMETEAPLIHSAVRQERGGGEPLSKFAESGLRSYLHEVLKQEHGDAALGAS